ncbi:alpha/beta fold hydrolase [Eubacterium xylanophilum]|uniref:alpha/beta fold hydrolase n=1 Tax=Eubacterium xylanophilum TaxID=39497 RepID=UPI0004BAE23D|nr:alpha/beta hydrolase [Eubacterium xylanophilum]
MIEQTMEHGLRHNGEYVIINDHKIHIYRAGNKNAPKLLFMSGSGTVAPVYDFKVLYQKLLSDFEVIVIEKFGYGYSDLYNASTDVDSLISYHREALDKAGIDGPFILLPHSLSGLEAIRWKQTYPEEIKAIVGLDMAVPAQYLSWGQEELDKKTKLIIKMQKLHKKGLLFWYPLNKRGLSKDDISQLKLLWKRNGMNDCYIDEARNVLDNAKLVDKTGEVDCPILMFVSDGKQVSANWIQYQNEFAKRNNAKIIQLNCGHYVHYYESDCISDEIKKFIK